MAAEELGREALATLQSEHAAKLNVWVRERQVAAVHAWACALGVELRLRAFTSVEAFMAANEPMTTDLVLGLDLDPSSADDFRLLVAQSLTPRGFVVAGLQMTEDGSDAHEEVDEVAESLPRPSTLGGTGRGRRKRRPPASFLRGRWTTRRAST